MYEKMIVGLGLKLEKKIYYAKLKRHWDEIKGNRIKNNS